MISPTVSVVIPVKNEGKKIRKCLEGILSQSVQVAEILVIDSGSTDGTQAIVREFPLARLIEIAPETFNHGGTRNLGIREAKGDFVLMTVGDAWPVDRFWIEELLKGFTDEQVVAVCGQQVVPHEKDKNPVEWFRPQSQPGMTRYEFSKASFEALSPQDLKEACGWDDVSAMYRRTVMLQYPFPVITYGEDGVWAKGALERGMALVYNYAARVYHYHLENETFTFKRTLTTAYFRYRQFGYLTPQVSRSFLDRIRMIRAIWRTSPWDWTSNMKWYRYNLEQYRATKKALDMFHSALKISSEELEALHTKYCGKPPIPSKQ